MTTYRTVLPPVDSRFYSPPNTMKYYARPNWGRGGESDTYVPVDEAIEKIREVAYPLLRPTGEIVVDFEAQGSYELAVMVKDLEDELNAYQYWQSPLIIERPRPIRTKTEQA